LPDRARACPASLAHWAGSSLGLPPGTLPGEYAWWGNSRTYSASEHCGGRLLETWVLAPAPLMCAQVMQGLHREVRESVATVGLANREECGLIARRISSSSRACVALSLHLRPAPVQNPGELRESWSSLPGAQRDGDAGARTESRPVDAPLWAWGELGLSIPYPTAGGEAGDRRHGVARAERRQAHNFHHLVCRAWVSGSADASPCEGGSELNLSWVPAKGHLQLRNPVQSLASPSISPPQLLEAAYS
jgi:hypothetical protein